MKNNKFGRVFPLKSVFRRCLRYFTLAILTTIVLSGCGSGSGGGGGGSGSSGQPVATQADVIIAAVNNDPELVAVATDQYAKKEVIGVSVEKDETGNPTKLKSVHYLFSGVTGDLEVGTDGLPSVLSDEAGNKLVFTNYTAATVDVTFIDYEGNQISGPHTIPIDAVRLTEFRNSYATALQGVVASSLQMVGLSTYEDVARFEETKLWLSTAVLSMSELAPEI